ncbi:hypothetical protein COLO4_18034 [Corchorus olitorius]|uniref:Uncharacterized protein n=1 Tax=Corchorus olitorius TaxID=93759 RepID=A0A1R3JAS3_9ROSI|nr:hypothetical protein COLO4_18034 [Corchorus olitorius]
MEGNLQPNKAQVGNEEKSIENLLAESVGGENPMEKHTETTVEETPMKMKMQCGQEGKSEKTFEAPNPNTRLCVTCAMCVVLEKSIWTKPRKEGNLHLGSMIGAEKSSF